MSTTTDAPRADMMYNNAIGNSYPAIATSGMAAAEILETLTGKRSQPPRAREDASSK
jgi:hypothetical protein